MFYKDVNVVVFDMVLEVLFVCIYFVILVSDFIDLFFVGFYCLIGFCLELWVQVFGNRIMVLKMSVWFEGGEKSFSIGRSLCIRFFLLYGLIFG